MSTEDTLMKALFAQQRAQILHMKITAPQLIGDSYAYAWQESVYPFLHDGDYTVPDMPHENFPDQFIVSKSKATDIDKYLDNLWRQGESPTFYQLEEEFGGKNERFSLIRVCRYLSLNGSYDVDLWDALQKKMEHPSEAGNLSKPFSSVDISL